MKKNDLVSLRDSILRFISDEDMVRSDTIHWDKMKLSEFIDRINEYIETKEV